MSSCGRLRFVDPQGVRVAVPARPALCSQARRHLLALTGAALWPGSASRAAEADRADAWHDAGRGRELPWRLRLPSGAGPWPLVLYSHGLGGNRDGGDAWGEAWRAAGLAVLHVQHAGSDSAVLQAGWTALRAAASAEHLFARVGDIRFVLDEVARRAAAGQAPWRDLRLDAVGMAGHSFGAVTAQALAGQRYPVPADLAEARLRAFIAFSPSLGRTPMSPAAMFSAVDRPFLAVTGSLDGDPFGAYAGGDSRARVYEGLPAGRRALLWLDGADHMSFAGNAARRIGTAGAMRREAIATERERAHHALMAHLTTLWWQAQLPPGSQAERGRAESAQAALRELGTASLLASGDRWLMD